MYPIKFDLYREPTDLKQISHWPLGFGIILLVLIFLIIYLSKYLPLELQIFYFIEIVGEFTLHLIALSVIFISTGLLLRHLSWRKGTLTITEDRAVISGNKEFYLKYDGITRLRYLKKNTIQIRTRYYPVRIKFQHHDQMEHIGNLLEKKNNGITQHNRVDGPASNS